MSAGQASRPGQSPAPSLGRGIRVATALKDGGQEQPGTRTGKGKSLLALGPPSPHPSLQGRTEAPAISGRLGMPRASRELGALGAAASREVAATPPGAFGECSSGPQSLRPQAT